MYFFSTIIAQKTIAWSNTSVLNPSFFFLFYFQFSRIIFLQIAHLKGISVEWNRSWGSSFSVVRKMMVWTIGKFILAQSLNDLLFSSKDQSGNALVQKRHLNGLSPVWCNWCLSCSIKYKIMDFVSLFRVHPSNWLSDDAIGQEMLFRKCTLVDFTMLGGKSFQTVFTCKGIFFFGCLFWSFLMPQSENDMLQNWHLKGSSLSWFPCLSQFVDQKLFFLFLLFVFHCCLPRTGMLATVLVSPCMKSCIGSYLLEFLIMTWLCPFMASLVPPLVLISVVLLV